MMTDPPDFAARVAAACPGGTRAEVLEFIERSSFVGYDNPEFVDYVLEQLGEVGRVEVVWSALLC